LNKLDPPKPTKPLTLQIKAPLIIIIIIIIIVIIVIIITITTVIRSR
jgi:heme/copper-type cytochrome/quinol oxidase subunit 2